MSSQLLKNRELGWASTPIKISAANILFLTVWTIIWSNAYYESWDEYLGIMLVFPIPSTFLLFIGTALSGISKRLSGVILFLGIALTLFTAFVIFMSVVISSIG